LSLSKLVSKLEAGNASSGAASTDLKKRASSFQDEYLYEHRQIKRKMIHLGYTSSGLDRSPAKRRDLHGGTLVNIVTALIILGLIGLGLWWLIKSFGQAGQQYSETLIDTKYTAITVKCQMNLRAIWQNLQMYAVANGSFPSSLEALVEWSGNSRLFRCPASGGQKYVYVPGQSSDLPPQNVLVYEPGAVHDGRCSVLLLGGQVGLLTPEELKVAVARTLASLK
jgi:hypothetical protein